MINSSIDSEIAIATRTLSELKDQADKLRTELLMMRRELAEGNQEIHLHSARLAEVNEKLVLAALHSNHIAETAVSELFDVTAASQRDPRTNLPNRPLILDRIERSVALAERAANSVAIFYVGLDHFKMINDLHGHSIGDEVLWEVARRLEAAIRTSDSVGRISGDEFLVLLPTIANESDAALVATKLLSAIAAPVYLNKVMLQISASVGIAIYPGDGLDASTLISRADEAMYRAKLRGGGSFEIALPPVPDLPLDAAD